MAMKKGVNVLDRGTQVHHMAELQALLDFPPAPKLDLFGRLDPAKAFKPVEVRGRLAMADGPIKTFSLRGIKDSPPYLHDGRLLTLDDTVELFNLILGLDLAEREKRELVAFLLAL